MKTSTRKAGRLTVIGCATGAVSLVTCLFALSSTQQLPGKSLAGSAAEAAGVSTATEGIPKPKFSRSVSEVLRLVDADIGGDVIKTYIQSSKTAFVLDADGILALAGRGVPSDIVVAMLARNRELRSRATQNAATTYPSSMPGQPGGRSPIPWSQPGQHVEYGPDPAYVLTPIVYSPSYAYSYGYSYSSYPLYRNWWWPASGSYAYRSTRGWADYHPAAKKQWLDAYPNRLVTGPNWGADRGMIASSQGQWADAYPNRLVTGPNWGADRGTIMPPLASTPSQRATAYPNRVAAGPNWGADRASVPRPAVYAAQASTPRLAVYAARATSPRAPGYAARAGGPRPGGHGTAGTARTGPRGRN